MRHNHNRRKRCIFASKIIVNEHQKIQILFFGLGIDSRAMLYGLDHVHGIRAKINSLKE